MKKSLSALLAAMLILNLAAPAALSEEAILLEEPAEELLESEEVVEVEETVTPEAPAEEDVTTEVVEEIPVLEEEIPTLPADEEEALPLEIAGRDVSAPAEGVTVEAKDVAGVFEAIKTEGVAAFQVTAGKILTLTGTAESDVSTTWTWRTEYEGTTTPIKTAKASKNTYTITTKTVKQPETFRVLTEKGLVAVVTVVPAVTAITVKSTLNALSVDHPDQSAVLSAETNVDSAEFVAESKGVKWSWPTTANKYATIHEESGTCVIASPKKAGSITITATANDGSAKKVTYTVKIVAVGAEKVELKGSNSVAAGKTIKLTATVTGKDGATNVTNKTVKWESDTPSVATVSAGSVKGIKAGTATITVSLADNPSIKAEMELNVKNPTYVIVMDESIQGFYDCDDAPIALSGTAYADAKKTITENVDQNLLWTSSNTTIAKVEDGQLVLQKVAGSFTLTATAQDGTNKKVSKTIKVIKKSDTVTITNTAESICAGSSLKLTATTSREDGTKPTTTDVNWEFADEDSQNYATLTKGVLKLLATAAGKTIKVRAVANDGLAENAKSADKSFTVTAPTYVVVMNDIPDAYDCSETEPITLSGTAYADAKKTITDNVDQTLLWTSSNAKIAKIEDGKLVLTGTLGSFTLTATAQDGTNKKATKTIKVIRKSELVTVTNTAESICAGSSLKLTATTSREDGTKPTTTGVTWVFADEASKSYATLTKGVLKANTTAAGKTVSVKAIANDGLADNAVSAPKTITIYAAATRVNVATADNATTATLNLQNPTIKTVQLKATVLPEDGALQKVTWKTSSSTVASVDDKGLVTIGTKTGSATITATTADGKKSGTFTVKVIDDLSKITIDNTEEIVHENKPLKLTASLYRGETKVTSTTKYPLVWSSSDNTVATVSTTGVVTVVANQTVDKIVTITAASKNDPSIFATYELTARPALKVTIEGESTVNLNDSNGPCSPTVQLTAAVTPASVVNEQNGVTWEIIEGSDKATIDSGLVTFTAAGTVKIRATSEFDTDYTDTFTIQCADNYYAIKAYIDGKEAAETGYLFLGDTLKPTAKLFNSAHAEDGVAATSKDKVEWSLTSADENGPVVATINDTTGAITTSGTLEAPVSVTVTLTYAENVSASFDLKIVAKPEPVIETEHSEFILGSNYITNGTESVTLTALNGESAFDSEYETEFTCDKDEAVAAIENGTLTFKKALVNGESETVVVTLTATHTASGRAFTTTKTLIFKNEPYTIQETEDAEGNRGIIITRDISADSEVIPAFTDAKTAVLPDEIDGAKVIGVEESLFAGNETLTSVTLPEGLTALSNGLFEGCSELVKVTMPNSVETINEASFKNCTKLEEIACK